jgi:Class II Aldolase and Adducin N-terminal domain
MYPNAYISVTVSSSQATLHNRGAISDHCAQSNIRIILLNTHCYLLSDVSVVYVLATILDHHGMYCVGSNLPEAFFVTYHLNQACDVQVSKPTISFSFIAPIAVLLSQESVVLSEINWHHHSMLSHQATYSMLFLHCTVLPTTPNQVKAMSMANSLDDLNLPSKEILEAQVF